MTNKELQELLKQYPDDMPVYMAFDGEGADDVRHAYQYNDLEGAYILLQN